ncbi:glutamate racemase [Candidatus Nomurabacteria bacterium]|nr:glutamate racemase [Candidatus Nomurabacteria bacterium]
MKIGFFDSGLGGIVIMKAVAAALPQYDYEFYGDTLNLPFGDKTEEEIFKLTKAGMEALFAKDCLINIVACNTSSAESMRKLQDTFLPAGYPDRRILGVIIPAVEELIDKQAKKVILLATKRTIESGKYERELKNRHHEKVELYGVATPALVPLIEAGNIETATKEAARVLLDLMASVGEVDSVVLGCTHYTLLRPALQQAFPEVTFVSQDEFVPHKLEAYLTAHPEHEQRLSRGGTRNIQLTQDRQDYDQIIAELLGGVYLPQ